MTNKSPVLEAVENINDSIEAYKRSSDKNQAEIFDRLEQVEAKADLPSKTTNFSRDEVEHKDLFCEWVKKPHDGHAKRRLEEAEHELSTKSVLIGTDSAGGYALPALIQNQIEERVTVQNPFRQICQVQRVGSSDYAALVSHNEMTSGWVAEQGSRAATTTSRLAERKPSFGTLYAYPSASEEAFQDVFFDVQNWLVQEIGDAFAAAEATAIVTGNGTAKPTGFLNSTPVTTADSASPERAVGTLQYIPMDSASPQALGADDLIDLMMSVQSGYLMNPQGCAWVMRRSTAATVRKLKSTNGDYYWQPSLQQGQPDMLLGFPVFYTDAMQSYVADAHPIAFGSWQRGYLIADRSEIRLSVDDNVTTPGYLKFYARKRVGGCVLNSDALKVLKFADT